MTPIRTLRPLAKVVLSTQSDERLVALSREGSEDAFAEIVRRHRPGLLRLARSLGTGDRADDVVQDGLVRAWRALKRSDAEIDLRPWLATIIRNRALTAHSTNRVHEELDDAIDGVRQPGDIVIMREELRSAVSAVNSLPDPQREALVRSALSGESHAQIASALATSPGAVRQLIFRARTGLREAVGACIPLPVVRALADVGAGGAAVGATAAVATAGGAGLGMKALTLIAVGAAVAGSGVALEDHTTGAQATETPRASATATTTSAPDRSAGATPAGSADAGRPAAETAAPAAVAAKDALASRSSALSTTDTRNEGSPRIDDPAAGESTEHEDEPPTASQAQQPPRDPQPVAPGGQFSGHDGPRDGGDHHQPPPPPPPPPGEPVPTDGTAYDGYGGDGRHDGPRDFGQQPAPTDAPDGGGATAELGDSLLP